MNWYLAVLRNFADFSSRASRMEFWMFTLVNLIIITIVSALCRLLGWSGTLVDNIYNLVVFIPALAVAVRRLHDTGRTGWWLLIAVIPLVDLILLVFFVQASQPGANEYGVEASTVTA
jgi:uncharacterized membrane protein YhaH (DUF805 family)